MTALVALAGVLLVVSCSTNDKAVATGPPVNDAHVGLVEWQIVTTDGALVAGPVTIHVTNAGTTRHDLRVTGAHVDVKTPRLRPGESATLQVDLTGEQRVEVFCTVPGHRTQGMHHAFVVEAAPPGSTSR